MSRPWFNIHGLLLFHKKKIHWPCISKMTIKREKKVKFQVGLCQEKCSTGSKDRNICLHLAGGRTCLLVCCLSLFVLSPWHFQCIFQIAQCLWFGFHFSAGWHQIRHEDVVNWTSRTCNILGPNYNHMHVISSFLSLSLNYPFQ